RGDQRGVGPRLQAVGEPEGLHPGGDRVADRDVALEELPPGRGDHRAEDLLVVRGAAGEGGDRGGEREKPESSHGWISLRLQRAAPKRYESVTLKTWA